MSDSIYARENVIQFPVRRAVKRDARRQTQYDALIDQLQAAHAREKVWLREKSDLLQRHVTSRFPRSSSIGLGIVCK
jgi:hypothetical protein